MSKKNKIEYYIQNFKKYNIKIPWKIFVKIMTSHYGCDMVKKKGSARLFIRGNIRITAHEPHGRDDNVSKLDRQRVIKYLINKLEL